MKFHFGENNPFNSDRLRAAFLISCPQGHNDKHAVSANIGIVPEHKPVLKLEKTETTVFILPILST